VVAVYIGVHMGFGVVAALLFASLMGGMDVAEPDERAEAYDELAATLEEVVPSEEPVEEPREAEETRETVSPLKLLSRMKPKPAAPDWQAARAQVRVGGTMKRGGRRGAMINGQVVMSGELVTVEYKGHLYRWRLDSIKDGMADLKQVRVDPVE